MNSYLSALISIIIVIAVVIGLISGIQVFEKSISKGKKTH
jgi:uncharacterized protein YneF (UPF0154 family)